MSDAEKTAPAGKEIATLGGGLFLVPGGSL